MRHEIFEPEDRLYGQTLQMLENRQRRGGHFAECRDIVMPGESSGNGPFEQRHTLLSRNRLQQCQHPVFFNRLDGDQRVMGTNKRAEIVDSG